MLHGILTARPPFVIVISTELKMKAEVRVLVLWDFAGLNHVPLQKDALPGLLLKRLVHGGRKEWHQVLIS